MTVTKDGRGTRAGTRTVALSTFWNLIGRVGPIFVAILITPSLVRTLGVERWGVFTIALSLVGTFGIFDFGLGRAITRAVAESVGAGEEQEVASLVLTGMTAMAALGAAGGLVSAVVAGYWVRNGLQISTNRESEVLFALYVLCASAPLVILNAAMWGVIAAFQKFRAANLVNIPVVTMYYLGPWIALHVWNNLIAVMLVLVSCRLVMTFAYWRLCIGAMPSLLMARLDFGHIRPLARIGGWMTVSNIIFPTLFYLDRFLIASYISAAETGYYTTSFDLVSRFSIIQIAIMNTAFPAMAASFRIDPPTTVAVFRHSIMSAVALLFPVCVVVVTFSNPIMTLWIGPAFAVHAAPVLSWLGVGAMIACADGIVAGLIDSVGRPDVNARLSILELVFYVPLLVIMLWNFGIVGAAMASVVRTCLDFSARVFFVRRLYPPVAKSVYRVALVVGGGASLLMLPSLSTDVFVELAFALVSLGVFVTLLWFHSLVAEERILIKAWSMGAIAVAGSAMKWR